MGLLEEQAARNIANRIAIEKSMGKDIDDESCLDMLEKAGRAAAMGEVRTWNGKEYIKTPKGWRPKPKGYKSGGKKEAEKNEKREYASMDIKEAKKELVGKKITFKEYFFDGRGGYKDGEGEIKNVRLYGKEKQPIAEIDFPNGDSVTISLDQLDKRLAADYKIEFDDNQPKGYKENEKKGESLVDMINRKLKEGHAAVKDNMKDDVKKIVGEDKEAKRSELAHQLEELDEKLFEHEKRRGDYDRQADWARDKKEMQDKFDKLQAEHRKLMGRGWGMRG